MAPAGAEHRQVAIGRFQKERLKRFGPGIALGGGKLTGAAEQHRVDAVEQFRMERIARDVHAAELVGVQAAAFQKALLFLPLDFRKAAGLDQKHPDR